MKASAHRDLIIIMRHRPGTHPPTELAVRLDHDHRNAALRQADRSGDGGNTTACHTTGLDPPNQPRRTARRRMTDGTRSPTRPPAAAAPNDHGTGAGLRARKLCKMPRCQPDIVRLDVDESRLVQAIGKPLN
jgi:hypothetical protein